MRSKKLTRLNKKVYKQDLKDHRDYIIAIDCDQNVSNFVDLRKFCPSVKSDLNIRSSLTHPILSAIETMINIEMDELFPNKKRKKFRSLSRYIKDNNHDFTSEYALYNNITTTSNRDEISFRHILKTLQHNSFIMKTIGMVTQEKSYKIEEYARIQNSGNHNGNRKSKNEKSKIIDDMKYILSQKIPIIGAIRVPDKFHSSKDGILNTDNVKMDFNYGVLFVGYTDNMHGTGEGYFIFQNSWGKRWGDKGYGYISFNSMMKQRCFDLWIITKFECENHDFHEHKLLEISVPLNIQSKTDENELDGISKIDEIKELDKSNATSENSI